jgi:hypothetical protein
MILPGRWVALAMAIMGGDALVISVTAKNMAGAPAQDRASEEVGCLAGQAGPCLRRGAA